MKLDRLLVRGISSDPLQHALAETLTTFAQRIGSTATEEGIEDAATVDALRGLGSPTGRVPTSLGRVLCR